MISMISSSSVYSLQQDMSESKITKPDTGNNGSSKSSITMTAEDKEVLVKLLGQLQAQEIQDTPKSIVKVNGYEWTITRVDEGRGILFSMVGSGPDPVEEEESEEEESEEEESEEEEESDEEGEEEEEEEEEEEDQDEESEVKEPQGEATEASASVSQ